MADSSPPRPQASTSSTAAAGREGGGWRQSLPIIDASEVSEFLRESRNSPAAQRRNYEDAQREHQRVLSAALHVFELHQHAEAQRQADEAERQRQERVAAEERRIQKERQARAKQLEDEARLAAQKAAPIPVPKPVLPPPKPSSPVAAPAQPTPAAPVPVPTPALNGANSANSKSIFGLPSTGAATAKPSLFSDMPPNASPAPATSTAAIQSPFKSLAPTQSALPVSVGLSGQQATAPPQPAPSSALQQPTGLERHIEVHKKLKDLRKFVADQATKNPALKARMGDMRRDIRKSFGQLTSGGLKENRVPVNRIVTVLLAGLKEVPSEMMDPNQFMLEPRMTPVEGAPGQNEPMLPSLFLYLLNILAKAAISQFVNESGADTRTAESIGQAVVKVYSENDFIWRGKSMIDMLIAKYGVMCPVLFGVRASDRTEQGRALIGWRKESGRWISEQYHTDRMTGLGAGFAAMTLRDFSRNKRVNPWPPSVYWTALSRIVNTPPPLMSETQCYVLKAMIANNEARFMEFYGNAAVAALRCALVDYPSRMPKSTAASETLKVLAKTISMRTGLDLGQV